MECRNSLYDHVLPKHSFNLAKFLVPILNLFTCNEHTTVNTHSFVNEITYVPGASNYYMVSFDLEFFLPMFHCMRPQTFVCLLFIKTGHTVLGLPLKFFKTLLELSVLNSFFAFNGKFYKQIKELGMGLQLGPTFANIFMCFHESSWLADCSSYFRPIFYKIYIDDTFMLFKHKEQALSFLDYLTTSIPL